LRAIQLVALMLIPWTFMALMVQCDLSAGSVAV